jgi:hypothetical protein
VWRRLGCQSAKKFTATDVAAELSQLERLLALLQGCSEQAMAGQELQQTHRGDVS